MEYSIAIILVALLQYLIFTFRVGFSRLKNNVLAPKTTGNEEWKIKFRIQQNTLEQLIVFIPAILVFAYFGNPAYAAGLGAFFLVGRIIYFVSYVKDPTKRGVGFIVGWIPMVLMVLAGLVSVVTQIMR